MTTPCECRLNGLDPRDADPAVVLTDVREHPPLTERPAMAHAGRDGTRAGQARVTALPVTLTFELHEPDPARRKHLCRALARWAAPGGWLTLGDRPGQRLRVICDAPPVIGSTLGWTQPVTLRLTAYDAPWWESATPAAVWTDAAAASGRLDLRYPGDRPAPLEAALTSVAGGVIGSVALTCGGQTIRLSGLGMAPGESLLLTHDERGIARLLIRGADGDRSALPLRDAASADEIWLAPGAANAITFTADGPVTARFTVRGRWM